MESPVEGILLLDKPEDKSSFYLVKRLRALTKVKKIGHAGTLDPFATGLMVLLIGKKFTTKSDLFLHHNKSYETTIHLGFTTASYDKETPLEFCSDKIPTKEEVLIAIEKFQGSILQIPPMFSAKKINGTRLYDLARKGETVERKACPVTVKITLLDYTYPRVRLKIECSKGTYIRSLGHDIGQELKTGAFLESLRRTSSGNFSIENSVSLSVLEEKPELINQLVIKDYT
jgi:tRNA pseudouridine55 synthase